MKMYIKKLIFYAQDGLLVEFLELLPDSSAPTFTNMTAESLPADNMVLTPFTSHCFLNTFLSGLCRSFCIFERFSNPESCRSKQMRYQLSQPSPYNSLLLFF
jgi:hypothetical protein